MITINLHKQDELDVQVAFPSQWDELLPNEILAIAKAMINSTNAFELRAEILLLIIESRCKQAKQKLPKKWKDMVDAEQFFIEGNALLDFIFGENRLTKIPENEIKLQGTRPYTVYAPEKGFQTVTCGEFEDCEPYYFKFIKSIEADSPDMKYLAQIAAILYREQNTPYYTRKNNILVAYNADNWLPMFQKLEAHRLYAIFIWYTGCKNYLPKLFPTMHEPDPEANESNADPLSFTKCIHAGAGPKNGTRDNIRLMTVFEFMFDMEQESIKAKELRNQMKDASSK